MSFQHKATTFLRQLALDDGDLTMHRLKHIKKFLPGIGAFKMYRNLKLGVEETATVYYVASADSLLDILWEALEKEHGPATVIPGKHNNIFPVVEANDMRFVYFGKSIEVISVHLHETGYLWKRPMWQDSYISISRTVRNCYYPGGN